MASAGAHTDERCRQPAFLPGPPPPEVESSSGSAKVSAAPSRAEPCHAAPSRATPRDACAAGCLCRAAPSRAEPCRLRCSPSPRVSLEGPREPAQPGLPAANLRAVRCGGCGAVRCGDPPGTPKVPARLVAMGVFPPVFFFFFNNYLFFICFKKYVVIIFAWVGGAQRCPHPLARLLRAPCAGRARRGRGEGGGGGAAWRGRGAVPGGLGGPGAARRVCGQPRSCVGRAGPGGGAGAMRGHGGPWLPGALRSAPGLWERGPGGEQRGAAGLSSEKTPRRVGSRRDKNTEREKQESEAKME